MGEVISLAITITTDLMDDFVKDMNANFAALKVAYEIKQANTGSFQDSMAVTSKIQNNAIISSKIEDETIGESHIAISQITNNQIQDFSITIDKIQEELQDYIKNIRGFVVTNVTPSSSFNPNTIILYYE